MLKDKKKFSRCKAKTHHKKKQQKTATGIMNIFFD
jgi:hypothetical protein